MFASICENDTNTLDDQFTYANTRCTGITTSTLCYDSGVVVRLSFGEKLPRTQNQVYVTGYRSVAPIRKIFPFTGFRFFLASVQVGFEY